jgi:hypothetical protein
LRSKTFHKDIATHWEAKENHVFGELVWAPPIVLSTEPGEYTLDLAIIKINPAMLDASNYLGNTINIGNKYTRQEFMKKVYSNPTSPEFPASRLITLKDQVPESALMKPPMLDDASESCLVVFKDGPKTDTTIKQRFVFYPHLLCRPVGGVEGVASDSHQQGFRRILCQRGLRVLYR